jgi:hypothetical protein
VLAECASGSVCLWACCVNDCSGSRASSGDYSFQSAGSCAQAVGAPNCTAKRGDCANAWSPPPLAAVGERENASLQVGFGELLAVTGVGIVQNSELAFVTSVEVLDFATNRWVLTRVVDALPSVPPAAGVPTRFSVPGGVVAQSVRVNVTSNGNGTQIDAVLLIGRNDPPVGCLPTLELTPHSTQIDSSVADQLCVNAACQWACRLNECSSFRRNDSTDEFGCRNALGFAPDSTFWSQATSGGAEFIDVSFAQFVVASHVVVIDNDDGNGVTGVDVWVNGSFVAVFDAPVVGTGMQGAEIYAFTRIIDAPVNRVRVRIRGYRIHRIEAIRLVGRLVVPTQRSGAPPPRLPGQFRKSVISLASTANGRMNVLAQNNPAPVVDDIVYVPAGRIYNDRFSTIAQTQFDRCNVTSQRCRNFTASFQADFPGVSFDSPAAAALRVGDQRVLVVGGGRSTVGTGATRTGLDRYFYRSESLARWFELPLKQRRREACLVSVPAVGAMFIGGGQTRDNLFGFYGSIEKISFGSDLLTPTSEQLAFSLNPARAEPGCAVIGASKRFVMFAGGRHYVDPIQVASDVVEILDVDTLTLQRTLMSRKTVAVTIVSLGAITVLAGGSPTFGPPTSGVVDGQFDYSAQNTLGVERYDLEANMWQYVPMVLTPLVYDRVQPDRLPAFFAGRFLAVVAGQTTFAHDGSQDPERIGQSLHARPIDVFDTFTNAWYLNVMEHHAGGAFMVAAVGNVLAVVGGRGTPETFFHVHNRVSLFEWVPHEIAPHDCAVSTTCSACLYTNVSVHTEPCRWCFDAVTLAGSCQPDRLECAAPRSSAARAPAAVCRTAPPTPPPPPPAVPYLRFHRLRIDTDFATWVFVDYRAQLVAYLACPPEALSVPLPVEQGSVIAIVRHEEPATSRAAVYDQLWAAAQSAPTLKILNVTRLDPSTIDLPTPPPTSAPTVATSDTASSTTATTAKAPVQAQITSSQLGLYIAIGVLAGLVVLGAITLCACILLRRNRVGGSSSPNRQQVSLNDQALTPLTSARA